MLVIAGNGTTRHAITHGLLALADHPGALDRWQNQPDLEASAVEEIIRWSTPINWYRRQVTVDTMLGDVGLAAGGKLIVNFALANRDEERFDEPGRFDITRRPNHHMFVRPRRPALLPGSASGAAGVAGLLPATPGAG